MSYVNTVVPLTTLSDVTSMRDLATWLQVNQLTTPVTTSLAPMVTIRGHHWRDLNGHKIKLPRAKQLITDVVSGIYPIGGIKHE